MPLPAQNESDEESNQLALRQHYRFSSPIEADCTRVNFTGGWVKRKFAEGQCQSHIRAQGRTPSFYIFTEIPLGEKMEYYFHVDESLCLGEKISPSPLHLVK